MQTNSPINSETSAVALMNWPKRWFVNIIRLLEKREYNVYSILILCVFTGTMRLLEEWALGGQMWNVNPPAIALNFFSFYFLAFFSYGLLLHLLVPQPWRKSINVVRVGIFLGIFPPLIDVFVYGLGQRIPYGYVRDFPRGWSWLIYNPDNGVTLGETTILWLTVVLTGFYVWHKTQKFSRFLAALAGGYAVVLVLGTLVATAGQYIVDANEWRRTHLVTLVTVAGFMVSFAFYLVLQPRLAAGLLRRMVHTLPFVLVALAGFAFTGPLMFSAWVVAFLVAFIFAVALVQNDFYDAPEDRLQNRAVYVDGEDVTFMNVAAIACLVMLAFGQSMTSLTLGLILSLSFLYSYPYYKAKRFFPSNLKIEGMWGALAFTTGLIAGREQAMYGMPRWDHMHKVMPLADPVQIGLSPVELGALALVFGGFTLLGSLKDSKDIAADAAAGNQTLYTLWARKNRPVRTIHAVLSIAAALSLGAAFPLLWLAGKVSFGWSVLGLVFGLAGWMALAFTRLEKSFYYFLWIVSALLGAVVLALVYGS